MTPDPTHHVRPPWGIAALGLVTLVLVALDVPRMPVVAMAGHAPAGAAEAAPATAHAPAPPPGTVHVAIPAGVLAITTPYTAASPLELGVPAQPGGPATSVAFGSSTDIAAAVKILDTRLARLGFLAQVAQDDPAAGTALGASAGLVGVEAVQVQGNGLRSSDVRAVDAPPGRPGPTVPRTIASYAGGLGPGTAWLAGTFELTTTVLVSDTGAVTVTFTAF